MIHQSPLARKRAQKRHDALDYPLSALDETLDFSWFAQLTVSRTLGGVKACVERQLWWVCMRKLSTLLIHTFFNHFSIIPDVVCMNVLGTIDGRWRMYVCFWHMSVLSDSSLRNWSHEFCIVNEFRGTCLELGCNTASTTADLTSMCWPKMEVMTTTNWSMIDEWSLALTLALQQMLTEVFTAQRCSLCLVACSLHDFLCQAWMDSPVFTAPTGRRHMNLAHDSGRCQRADLERKVSSLESLQERAKLYVMGPKKEDRYLCGSRALAQMDPETQRCKVIHVPISQERVVGAHPIVSALRTALGENQSKKQRDSSDT